MLPLVDANIILRYLLADDEAQFEAAKGVVDDGCEVTVEVMTEVVYVLAGRYEVPRKEIAASLEDLLDVVYLERSDELVCALSLYAEKNLDFIDCLLVAANEVSGRRVATFDKKIIKLLGDGSVLS